MKEITFIDLFAGIGGFRIGLQNNNAKCVFSSEIDKKAAETYMQNFGEYPAGDITKINSNEIPDHDILCGGFPCQPFSIGGLRKGFEDTRGTLFFEVARILKEKQPRAFLLENVKGIVSHDEGKTLKTILTTLDEIGYTCEYRIMNASDYGIPQNRERWYCVGFRKDLGVTFEENDKSKISYHFPKKIKLEKTVNDFIDVNQEGYMITETAQNNINKFIDDFYAKRGKTQYYTIANEIRASRCNFRNDGIVPCFTAKMGTGGNNVPVIVKLKRKLSERECLRLMGFPDSYKIKENYHQTYKQIGNSVVVSIIEMLSKGIVDILSRIDDATYN